MEVLRYCLCYYIAGWKVSQGKTLKKNREDLFEVQLNKNSEGLVTVVAHAMKINVWWSVKGLRTNCANANKVAWVGLGHLIYL